MLPAVTCAFRPAQLCCSLDAAIAAFSYACHISPYSAEQLRTGEGGALWKHTWPAACKGAVVSGVM